MNKLYYLQNQEKTSCLQKPSSNSRNSPTVFFFGLTKNLKRWRGDNDDEPLSGIVDSLNETNWKQLNPLYNTYNYTARHQLCKSACRPSVSISAQQRRGGSAGIVFARQSWYTTTVRVTSLVTLTIHRARLPLAICAGIAWASQVVVVVVTDVVVVCRINNLRRTISWVMRRYGQKRSIKSP